MLSNPSQNPAAARTRILSETFSQVTLDQAAALVGILFEYRFVLSPDMGNSQTDLFGRESVELLPLDPQAASIVVADAFELEHDQILSHFQENWATLKHSIVYKGLVADLRSHAAVSELVEHTRWV